MSFSCKIGIHNYVRYEQKTEEIEKDLGAVIEVWEKTFNYEKCVRCGKSRKKLNKKSHPPHGCTSRDERMLERKWKEEVDPDED